MIPTIPADKANHAIYGAAMWGLGALLARALHESPLLCGMAFSVIVGALKEAYDRWDNVRRGIHNHDVEFRDFLATAIGGAAMTAAGYVATA